MSKPHPDARGGDFHERSTARVAPLEPGDDTGVVLQLAEALLGQIAVGAELGTGSGQRTRYWFRSTGTMPRCKLTGPIHLTPGHPRGIVTVFTELDAVMGIGRGAAERALTNSRRYELIGCVLYLGRMTGQARSLKF